ncbi:hypothetical protein GCM10027592_41880 [Spirosoma flavus]
MNPNVTLSNKPLPAMADTHSKRIRWWLDLEPQWRAAFQYSFFRHSDHPSAEELENLWQTNILRLVGPKAPNPNMTFELTNCSGIKGMINLEILIVNHHQLTTIDELADLTHLKSLFVNNNAIQDIAVVKKFKKLEQLYAQVNAIESIEPVSELTNLRDLYVSLNALKTLNGITRKHSKTLKSFFCLPNDQLPDKEVIRVERNLGIRCRYL